MRELWEETGIKLNPEDVELCFAAPELAENSDSFITQTFLVKPDSQFYSENPNPEGIKFNTDETGRVAFVSKEALLEGSFGNYNRRLFQHVGIL